MARIDDISVGDRLPEFRHEPDTIGQFLYNAALWNAHRIHFDYPYATEEENYPGLVVAGPLMGDWLSQCVLEWLGDEGRLLRFEYANRRAAFVGDVLMSRGEVSEVDRASLTATLTLEIINESGDQLTPGSAVVQFQD
jgi:hydroxyacyl-ACP dehydratase HTD2-like protein with hotdog domain